ncbi:ABC transporter ATP-binding protein [Bacillus paramycoides]|uniref:ABC transporter ATP-binding protein n=1 Tax=Bacillus paramycoides TaxID=2026194 RepID=A0A1J9UW08_9BACI|nr:ABC transporter ATP-binding protein [Bacillus paramycoides]OJD82153.1 ABC transporter ATP-binding protein [Bacillus paramycoides]
MTSILKAQNISKIYGEEANTFYALKNVSLEVKTGEFLAIMGTSGSGKSTLLNILSGLDRPSSGEVLINNIKINNLNDNELTEIRSNQIGFIFQFFNLIPVLTAMENVTLPSELAGHNIEKIRQKASELLDLVGIGNLKSAYPSKMSGGQQQRVAIARALVTQPKIILADEPTGSLDSKTSKDILDLLREFCERLQHSLVVVTHDAMVASYSHRVIFLKDGGIQDELILKNSNLSSREKTSLIINKIEEISI